MHTLFNETDRQAILKRLQSLTPEHAARWGSLTAPRMVCHVSADLRLGLGQGPREQPRRLLARTPINWLVIHLLPWPKGVRTAPELLEGRPGAWEADVRSLRDLIEEFGQKGAEAAWPPHGIFGRISGRSWGVLQYRHLDHHFRQFGV